MISWTTSGNTARTEKFLDAMIRGDQYTSAIESLAQQGVDALRAATEVESGLTAAGWTYEIERSGRSVAIWWKNTHRVNGFNVAIGLRYGHATGTGGWVEGYNYIAPALQPIFDRIADAVWKEVQNS